MKGCWKFSSEIGRFSGFLHFLLLVAFGHPNSPQNTSKTAILRPFGPYECRNFYLVTVTGHLYRNVELQRVTVTGKCRIDRNGIVLGAPPILTYPPTMAASLHFSDVENATPFVPASYIASKHFFLSGLTIAPCPSNAHPKLILTLSLSLTSLLPRPTERPTSNSWSLPSRTLVLESVISSWCRLKMTLSYWSTTGF